MISEANRPGILIVGTFLSAEGKTRSVCEDLADQLAEKGWQVIRTSSKTGRLARLLDMLWTVFTETRNYSVAQVDVFSGLAFIWAEWVCAALRFLKKPYILTLHGGGLVALSEKSPARLRRLLENAKKVTTPSNFLLQKLKDFRDDLTLIPNPISTADYPFRLRGTPDPKLVWLRAFHQVYNPEMAPDVLARVQKEVPSATLLMVGPDKGDGYFEATKARVEALGLVETVKIVGGVPKEEVPAWLSNGDIFINTTHVDNTPISVLEAMACGLCVVSTSVGGLPYMLSDGIDALLVPANDPQAMAHAVLKILNNKILAKSLSENARKKALAVDWVEVLPQWEGLFTQVASKYA